MAIVRKVLSMVLLATWPEISHAQIYDASRCRKLEAPANETLCLAKVAKDSETPSVCMLSRREGVRWQCLAIYAAHSGDGELCRSIPTTTAEHLRLRDLCLSDVALARESPALCKQIQAPGLRDSCYLKIARSLCERINDKNVKSQCK